MIVQRAQEDNQLLAYTHVGSVPALPWWLVWRAQEYSQLEQTEGKDPARVQLLYERAVAALPVDSSLWDAYTTYVDKNLGKVRCSPPLFPPASPLLSFLPPLSPLFPSPPVFLTSRALLPPQGTGGRGNQGLAPWSPFTPPAAQLSCRPALPCWLSSARLGLWYPPPWSCMVCVHGCVGVILLTASCQFRLVVCSVHARTASS